MAWARWYLATALAATMLGTTVPVAAQGSELIVMARSSGFVDVTFADEVVLDSSRFTVPDAGDVAGYFLSRRGEPFTVQGNHSGSFYVRGLAGPDDPVGSRTLSVGDGSLAPGAYRLHVVTDRPLTMRIPLKKGPARRLSVSRRGFASEAAGVQTTLTSTVAEDRALNVTASTMVLSVAGAYSSAGATAQVLEACVLPRASVDADGDCPQGTFPGVTTSTGLNYGVGLIAVYGPGTLPSGPVVARGRVTAGGSIRRAVTGFVAFEVR